MDNNEKCTYRIKVEVIGEEGESKFSIDNELVCNGFVIVGNRGDDADVIIHHVTLMDIAQNIAESSTLMAASCIAKGMAEASEIERKDKLSGLMNLLGRNN